MSQKLKDYSGSYDGVTMSAKELPNNCRKDTDLARQLLMILGLGDQKVFWRSESGEKTTYGLLGVGHKLLVKNVELIVAE